MSRATPPVALSFREFLVKILKPENGGVLELDKNVSCNPNPADLYLLESRASSSKFVWKPRKFYWIMECSIASVRRNGERVHFVIGRGSINVDSSEFSKDGTLISASAMLH